MKILHLFSNWKWTGPAEPAVNLAAELKRRGHEVRFACGEAPAPESRFLGIEAEKRGLDPLSGFRLRKHRHWVDNPRDVRALQKLLREDPVDCVHAHLDNDHLIALRAVRGLADPPPVFRSHYGGEPGKVKYLPRLLGATAGLLCVSERVRAWICEKYRVPGDRAFHVDGAIDLDRFRRSDAPAERTTFGVVARMQTHRRFEVLLEAFRQVAESRPEVDLQIIGRGTNQETVAKEPVRRMGLETRVHFPGYLRGDDYVAALNRLAGLIYLVPGSDGSCRTVREAMACGLPVIASRRGILPELVEDGRQGVLVDESAESLASALLALSDDETERRRLADGAHDKARERFGLDRQAMRAEEIYNKVLAGKP